MWKGGGGRPEQEQAGLLQVSRIVSKKSVHFHIATSCTKKDKISLTTRLACQPHGFLTRFLLI